MRILSIFLSALVLATGYAFTPIASGEWESPFAFPTALQGPSILTQYKVSELATIPEETIRAASDAVVLVTAYEEVPVYGIIYTRTGNVVEARREQVGILQYLVSSGSAFFVSEDGYLITNKHVVANDDSEYLITTDEDEYLATVVYRDPVHDIAVLKVNGTGFPALSFGDSGLALGEPVIAIGNALGTYVDSVSSGKVLSLSESIIASDRSGLQTEKLNGVIETSAKLYPGDSGGPLLNADGVVVGVSVATTVGERIGYAVPISVATAALAAAQSVE